MARSRPTRYHTQESTPERKNSWKGMAANRKQIYKAIRKKENEILVFTTKRYTSIWSIWLCMALPMPSLPDITTNGATSPFPPHLTAACPVSRACILQTRKHYPYLVRHSIIGGRADEWIRVPQHHSNSQKFSNRKNTNWPVMLQKNLLGHTYK